MRRHVATVAATAIALGLTLPASAQSADASKLPGGTWASIAKLPNFIGVWETSRGPAPNAAGRGAGRGAAPAGRGGGPGAAKGGGRAGGGGRGGGMLLTPAYQAMQDEYRKNPPQDSEAANCVPPGMPGIMTQPYPMEFLFTPGKVTILIEAYEQIRHVYTDGRPLPEDPDLTFNGNSVGHWDGDTLVVDTVGFTTATPLAGAGVHHSDKMHINERIRLAQPDLMEIVTTIEDPEALQQPMTRTSYYARHADWTLAEYVCQQNNRNFVSDDGKAGIDLTHP